MNCPSCGGPTIPMAFSVVCKAECDKVQGLNLASGLTPTDGDPGDEHPIGFDDEPTQPFVMASRCPACRSTDVEEFDAGITEHCWDCGHVWRVKP